MRARLSSRSFIGRIGELAELELAVREAASRRPTLVLLGGDSGVGKTRLVAELARRRLGADDGGPAPLILRGDAVQPADGELPYAAVLGALRPLVRDRDPALDALHAGARSRLARLLPGLDDAGGVESPVDGGDQLRLFEAILALLNTLSERAPLALILEDMHWAEGSTRAFVSFLAHSLREERVCVILTYRTDELYRRHPLRPLLSELERLQHARRIELDPFDRAELGEVLADILGSAPAPDLLERLLERSEGNPLYIEELLAAGLDGRGAPPRSLSDAFLGRIERLSPDAQRVARALSLGRALDEAALAAVTTLPEPALLPALREAVSEQVVVSRDEGGYGFRHALLREVLYDDLLPGERGALHAALARHLECESELGDDDERLTRVLSIAFHHLAAGDQPAALRACVIAAGAAYRGDALAEAADLYERALGLWPRVADPEVLTEVDHVELLCLAARALSIGGERARADALLREALAELDADDDPARYALVLGRRGRVLWALNRGAEAVAAGERALALIPGDDPGRDRAWIRGWLARAQVLRGRFREAATEAEAALKDAREVGDGLAETELLNTLGMVKVSLGQVEEGLESMRAAIALGRRRDDVDSVAYGISNLADTLLIAGRVGDGLQVCRDGLHEVPGSYVNAHDWLTLVCSELAFHAGQWELARACLSPRLERMHGTLKIHRQLREAQLAAGVGDEDRALECLDSVSDLVAESIEPQWISVFGTVSADVHARRGELEAAQAVVAQALDRMEVCTDDIARIVSVSLIGARVEGDRAQRARDLGDGAMRRDALARVKLHLDRIDAAAQDGGPVERMGLLLARGEAARARGRPAAPAWARAAEACAGLALPYPTGLARWREAENHVEGGDRREASVAAAEALEIADRLGSVWLAREVRGLAERARLTLHGPGGTSDQTLGEAPFADPFGLTERERQVLRLVAEGATNRQIGASLYMAEKTASVHVSRILSKLDVRSRTEAAAVAHRLHLS